MGQASRTTKLLLDLGQPDQGGANSQKRAALLATAEVLNQARAFYLDFLLAHAAKLSERVTYYSEEHLQMRERLISAHELLTWAESATVATAAHPLPYPGPGNPHGEGWLCTPQRLHGFGLDLDALSSQLLTLPVGSAGASRLEAAKSPTGLASAIGSTAHPPGEADRSEKGHGAQG